MKKRILVTGGAGFIGSNFCNLNQDRYEVIALDNLLLGDQRNLNSEIRFIRGDAGDQSDLNQVEPVDTVIHLAGTSSAPMFMDEGFVPGYVNSVASFVTTLDWARKNGAKKFLYASTSSLYGNNPLPLVESQHVTPPNHYAVTKELYEHCAIAFTKVYPEMNVIGFRFMSVYGPNEEAKGKYANIISQFTWDMARDRAPVIFGDGTQFRDFTNVRDIVAAMVLAIESKEHFSAELFNIGTGRSTSLNEIVTALNRAFGKNISAKYINNPVKEGYVMGQAADISKIQTMLGYKPTVKLEDGILEQVKNLRMERIRETSSDFFR